MTKPHILISKCLEFDHCRYDGQMIKNSLVESLKDYCEFTPVCPEVEIGLGVPRRPIKIVERNGARILYQQALDLDHTSKMEKYISELLKGLGEIDGIILKSRSPSCGFFDVKIYPKKEDSPPTHKSSGFFGGAIFENYPYHPREDEARLINPRIRDHFLKTLFTFSRFRKAKANGSMKALIDFHASNKLLFMSYNQTKMMEMGRILGGHKKGNEESLIEDYEKALHEIFLKGPRYTNIINTLLHAFGYFSKSLTKNEKGLFLDTIYMYRDDRVPLEACLTILNTWIARFEEKYLSTQKFFEPYPKGLGETYDVYREKDYW